MITDDKKARFEEIKAKIVQLNGVENASNLPADMKEFLIKKATAWRAEKQTGLRATTRAIVQDARCTLERISNEVRNARIYNRYTCLNNSFQLLALSARTEMQTLLFAVKGKPEHTMPGYVSVSEKGGRYLLHGLKRHSSDIVTEFESYVLGDMEGTFIISINIIYIQQQHVYRHGFEP